MRIFNLVFFALFVLFALLQYNDPDPLLWMSIYFYAAIMCWISSRGRVVKAGLWAGIIFCLAYAVLLFFEADGVLSWIRDHDAENIAQTMKAETPWIEDSREFFGLVIIIAVFGLNLYKSKMIEQPQVRV